MPDTWECPDCGKEVYDPPAPIGRCGCGSEDIKIVRWPESDHEYRDDPPQKEEL